MPSREQTIADAVQILSAARYPGGLRADTAWLGVYQALLWVEEVTLHGYGYLPHIIEADKLRPSAARTTQRSTPSAWQARADRVRAYLAQSLSCTVQELPSKLDRLMKLPSYNNLQRQNTLGIAFAGLIAHLMTTLGTTGMTFRTEVPADEIFAGITFPGRGHAPRIDILGITNGQPVMLVSAKWSLRHDRINDITNECPIYKTSYSRIYRSTAGHSLKYFVATNEFDPARLGKLLDDRCIDGVVHVHKKAVTDICRLNNRLSRLIDLSALISGGV